MARVVYFVKYIPPFYHVVHSNNNKIVSTFNSQALADANAASRNAQNPPATRDWDMAQAGAVLDVEYLLNIGFEPFAVDKGRVYLKKKAK